MRLAIVVFFFVALAGCARPPLEALSGAAMFPSMRPNAQCRVERPAGVLQRGHVVVARLSGRLVVRRVVGIAGDQISINDGIMTVNGSVTRQSVRQESVACSASVSARCTCQIVVERHGSRDVAVQTLHPTAAGEDFRCDKQDPPAAPPVSVPPGHFYLLADNRDAAADSRTLGPISDIVGRVTRCR